MYHLRAFRLFTGCLVAIVGFFASLRPAGSLEKTTSDRSIYHTDPKHLWNRLHEALFIRVGSNDVVYGQDRIEPLLWSYSKHLLEERSHKRAITLLEEFVKEKGEKLIDDPLKRALLQRDLWMVFNWLEGDHNDFEEPKLKAEEVREAKKRLRGPLAAVIGRLTLSPKEVRDLPDNYAAAVASGQFAKKFDPDKLFLPPDLFAADGPWVCLGRTDGPTAPQHLREDGGNRFTNSVFLVFVRLPDGRDATLKYLKQVCSSDQPLMIRNPDAGTALPFVPNPKLPQFPKGTEVALVRRALLIDSSHRVAVSPLTESVQLRVYREIPEISMKTLNAALVGGAEGRKAEGSWQAFHEFRISRALLFAGTAGGLRPVGADECDFKTGFNSHPWDELEVHFSGQTFNGPRLNVRGNCFACHSLPGVASFNSLQDFRGGLKRDGDSLRPHPVSEMKVAEVEKAAVKWKEGRPNWAALRKLLAE